MSTQQARNLQKKEKNVSIVPDPLGGKLRQAFKKLDISDSDSYLTRINDIARKKPSEIPGKNPLLMAYALIFDRETKRSKKITPEYFKKWCGDRDFTPEFSAGVLRYVIWLQIQDDVVQINGVPREWISRWTPSSLLVTRTEVHIDEEEALDI